jgi:4-hydroxyacetophenone monooxygenase
MMNMERPLRHELQAASDAEIEDAVAHADPMVLRGLVYQLTGDPDLESIEIKQILAGFSEIWLPASAEDIALVRKKAADFLKRYRDEGAGRIDVGPEDRLPQSLELITGEAIPPEDLRFYLEELALDPWVRSLQWQAEPDPEALADFTVTIIGAGMGGLNAALRLKQAGIPYTLIEKNDDVGGTWYENSYPGARVDTPSRGYTHLIGVDFGYPNAFCPRDETKRYFDWIADHFELRKDIVFNTEVNALTWNEAEALWEIDLTGPQGRRVMKSRAVITAVGFLNRPNIPDLPGAADFKGESWHTARWPQDKEWRGKRIAVIGTGATGYQMIPELALEAAHVTVFQRAPQWLFEAPGYRSPLPEQVNWLDRNFPFYSNFTRFRALYRGSVRKVTDVDPDFGDPNASSPVNKLARDTAIATLKRKIADPALVELMIPKHPVLSARPLMIDADYSFLEAIQRDNVTLVTSGIKSINSTGIEDCDGTQHDVDIIVYATGFRAHDYLYPMTITGRDGKTINELWAKDGARAYLSLMMPGFPNLFSSYGPNTNGLLHVSGLQEMSALYIMMLIERAILDGKRTIEVTEDAYWRYNRLVDERNREKVWSDPRTQSYYWSHKHNRSITQNPFTAPEMWSFLKNPDFGDLKIE